MLRYTNNQGEYIYKGYMGQLFKKSVKIIYSVNCIKPICCTYTLQSLHSQPFGSQFLIFTLNAFKDVAFFISLGTNSQVFGPLKERVSVPL